MLLGDNMEEVIELSKDLKKKHLLIIEDEKTVLTTIIKENFYNLLRKNKINYLVLETNKVDGKYFIEKSLIFPPVHVLTLCQITESQTYPKISLL